MDGSSVFLDRNSSIQCAVTESTIVSRIIEGHPQVVQAMVRSRLKGSDMKRNVVPFRAESNAISRSARRCGGLPRRMALKSRSLDNLDSDSFRTSEYNP